MRRELALLPPTDPLRDQGTPEEREQEERRRQLIELLAEIEKRINEENARPKKRYISPATREEVYALYYDQLRRKIEDRGTRNFPENQGKKLYGELTMNVTVDADGRVVETEVVRGSGSKVLDRRAVAIVARRGAVRPLQRRRCARRPTSSSITSRFRFTREEGLETTLSAAPLNDRARPDRYAVAGNPVAHSQSPFIHAEFARQTGEPVALRPAALPARRLRGDRARASPPAAARGCNVTMPFKFEAFALAARAHAARRAGRRPATCLRFDADGWLGDNTDGAGLVRDLERNAGVALRGARVLLIGAGGGAAGALGPLLAAGPAELVVANRTDKRAAALVRAPCRGGARRGDACCAPRPWTTAAAASTSSSTPAPAASPAPRCRSRRRCLRPGSAGARHDVRPAGRAPSSPGRAAHGATRPRRPGHAGRAGGRGLLLLARRAAADRRCCARCGSGSTPR